MAGQLILALAILVTFHEAGHFIAARAFGIKVEKFYMFFDAWGKKLFSFKKGDTEYGIGWLPLGGYVKIAGMIDESLDKEQLKTEPQPWEFRSKPAWQRFIVMIGGIVVNLILGVLLLVFHTYHYQKDYVPVSAVNETGIIAGDLGEKYGFRTGDKLISLNGTAYERYNDFYSLEAFMGGTLKVKGTDGEERDVVIPSEFIVDMKKEGSVLFSAEETVVVNDFTDISPARDAGFEKNDQLIAVNDTQFRAFFQLSRLLKNSKGNDAVLTVRRGNDTMNLVTAIDSNGMIGFEASILSYEGMRVPYTFSTATRYAVKDAWDNIYLNIKGFGKIFKGEIKARDSVQSVVGIAGMFGGRWIWSRFWKMTAIISLILAFMNALPIPALDGGHMMFLTYEIITGRPPAEKALMIAQYIGMVLLILLMVAALANDILRVFGF